MAHATRRLAPPPSARGCKPRSTQALIVICIALATWSLGGGTSHAQPATNASKTRHGEQEAQPISTRHGVADGASVEAAIQRGLRAFHAQAYQDALADFDFAIAALGSAAPAILTFNRASCLFALGRFDEARAAFEAVVSSASAPLSALAALNAGFSSLELGDLNRARADLARARELDNARALDATQDELEHELDSATQATTVANNSSQENASGTTASVSTTAGAIGLARVGTGLFASVSLGGGYDSNTTQAGVNLSDASAALDGPQIPSAFGRAAGLLFAGLALTPSLFMLAQYDVEQLAFTRSELDIYCAQDHSLGIAFEHLLPHGLRVGASGHGFYSFAGLRGFRRLAEGVSAELSATAAYAEHFESTLFGSLGGTKALDADYAFLGGSRQELGLQERYRDRALRGTLRAAYRNEGLGARRLWAPCTDCTASYTLPMSYQAVRISADATRSLLAWLAVTGHASFEWRFYDAPTTYSATLSNPLSLISETQTLWERRERQQRLSAGAAVTTYLPYGLSVTLRYDLAIANTNLNDGNKLAAPIRDFVRHQLELSVSADF